jgi:hypothetical protein
VGLVTLLLALVLGLLIWASYGVYAAQIAEAQSLGPAVLDLDYTLELYGPETAALRESLRQATLRARERFFGAGHVKPTSFTLADSRKATQATTDMFNALSPATDQQRELLATAKQLRTTVIQTQFLMSRQLDNPVPGILISAVIGWTMVLFFGHGLTSTLNPITLAAEALGTFSVSSALFLILEFSEPYSGVYKIKPAGIDKVIEALGK